MKNLDVLISNTSLELVSEATVCNFHNADHLDNLANKKGTNLNKAIEALKTKGEKGGFTLYAYNIGRSAHSATKVAILRGITNAQGVNNYYSKRMGEVFIK